MRLLLVAKYPPIQGGTAAKGWAIAQWLAMAGHEVHVVSNAPEVEADYRESFLPGDEERLDGPHLSGGSVTQHMTSAEGLADAFFIPQTTPYLSKLTAIGLSVARERDIDAVIGIYLEPYGLAAWSVARECGIPAVQIHAGSDLQRLAVRTQAAAAYWSALRSAAAVVTSTSAERHLLAGGVEPSRLIVGMPSHASNDDFRPEGPLLDEVALLHAAGGGSAWSPSSPIAADRTIGFMGKLGPYKGAAALLESTEMMGSGVRLAMLCGTGSRSSRFLADREAHRGTPFERVALLPFVAPWRVPEFIRSCDVLCYLENDFPVTIHRPHIPREVLMCGRPLVLSRDVARYQVWRHPPRDGVNVAIVEDPNDPQEIVDTLRRLLSDDSVREAISAAGHKSVIPSDPVRWVEKLVDVIQQCVEEGERVRVTSKALQQLMVRLYVDETARESVSELLEGLAVTGELEREEIADVLDVWGELRLSLDRFGRDLIEKRFRYLWSQFAASARLMAASREDMRVRFGEAWTFDVRSPMQEFGLFADMVLLSSHGGRQSEPLGECVAFDLARLAMRFDDPDFPSHQGSGWRTTEGVVSVRLTLAVENFVSGREELRPAPLPWLVMVPGHAAARISYVRLNDAAGSLVELCSGRSRSIDDLAGLLGLPSSEAVRDEILDAIDTLENLGVLERLEA